MTDVCEPKYQGYVANFCYICHGVTPHKLYKLQESSWFGGGESVGWMTTCNVCNTSVECDAEQFEEPVSSYSSCRELVDRTFPHIEDEYGERLELERTLRDRPEDLTEEQRMAFISLPLELAAVNLQVFTQNYTGWFGWTKIFLVLILINPMLIPLYQLLSLSLHAWFIDESMNDGSSDILFFSGYVIVYALVAFLTFHWFWPDPNSLDSETYRMLVEGLSPINPTKNELKKEMDRLNTSDIDLARYVDIDSLLDDISNTDPWDDALLDRSDLESNAST